MYQVPWEVTYFVKALQPPLEAETITPILQMRKLELWEVKCSDHSDLEVQAQT